VRYGVLGPLEVFDAVRNCAPTAPRLQTMLVLLLLRANRVVATQELMSELWGERRPASAANSLQVFVTRLRGLLAPRLSPRAPGQLLVTCPSGYRLRVGQSQLDLHRFDDLARDGQRALAAGDPASATRLLRKALGLWRGPPFAGVTTGYVLQLDAFRIEECRMRAVEQRIEADLRLGRHAELVPELETFASTDPLREGVHGQLMLALYRAGRQADAIEAYRRLRARLVEELAVEPGTPVQRLYRSILAADPSLDTPFPPVRAGRGEVCAQLPPDVADFTGRESAIALLETPLARAGRTAVPVVAVAGEAGVGKTTLAVHCAHRLGRRYPDGQLYLNLRGTTPHPLYPGYALGRLLRGLGVADAAIPRSVEERSELLRSRTGDRRVLLVLDDAAGEAQVRPLLPGGRHCGVVVTSQVRLPGLEGAVRVDLDPFSRPEAVRLLERLAGTERLDPDTAKRIVALCGHLPLAVRVAGAKLAAKRHWPPARVAQRLSDERRRLDELRIGDLDVRASIAAGYRARTASQRRALRLLGLLATADFPAWVATALLDVDQPTAELLLDGLVDAHLVHVARRDDTGVRYRLHDLTRLFAVEQLYAEEPPGARRAALGRLLAARARHPADVRPGGPPATANHPELVGETVQYSWVP